MPILYKVLHTINGVPTYSATTAGSGMFVGDRFRCSPSNVVLEVTAVNGSGAPTAFKVVSDLNLSPPTTIPTQEANASTILHRAVQYLLDQTWTDLQGQESKTVISYNQSIGVPGYGSWSGTFNNPNVSPSSFRIDANTKRAVSVFTSYDENLFVSGRTLRMFSEQGFVQNYTVTLPTQVTTICAAKKDLSIVVLASVDKTVTVVDYNGTATAVTTIPLSNFCFTLGEAVWNSSQTAFAIFEKHTTTTTKNLKCGVFTKNNGVWGVTTYTIGTSYVYNPGGGTLRPGTNDKCRLSDSGTQILVVDSKYAGANSTLPYTRYGIIDLPSANLLFRTVGGYGFTKAQAETDNIAISPDFTTVWQSTKSKHGWAVAGDMSVPTVFPGTVNTGVSVTINGVCCKKPDSYGVNPIPLRFVAVGNAGTILTSDDGTTWVQRVSGVTADLKDVIYVPTATTRADGGAFVAVGKNNTLLKSLDGITWTQKTVRCSGNAIAIVSTTNTTNFYYRVIVVGGGTVKAISSTDLGETWTELTVPTVAGAVLSDVTAGYDSKVVAVGNGGQMFALSRDSNSWYSLSSGTQIDLVSIAFSPKAGAPDGKPHLDGSFVAVGYGQFSSQRVILVSPDNNGNTTKAGTVWNQVTTPVTGWTSVVFDTRNERFVFSKPDGSIMYTSGNQIATSTLLNTSTTMAGVNKLKSLEVTPLKTLEVNSFLVAFGDNGFIRTASTARHFSQVMRKTIIDPTKLTFVTDSSQTRITTETAPQVTADAFMPQIYGVMATSFSQVSTSGIEFTSAATGPYLYKAFTSGVSEAGSESSTTFNTRPDIYSLVLGPNASQTVNPFTLPVINFPAWTVVKLVTEDYMMSGAYINSMTVTVTTPNGVITCEHDSTKQYSSFFGTVTSIAPTPNEIPIYSGQEELISVTVTIVS
jgi:hypothetical protein